MAKQSKDSGNGEYNGTLHTVKTLFVFFSRNSIRRERQRERERERRERKSLIFGLLQATLTQKAKSSHKLPTQKSFSNRKIFFSFTISQSKSHPHFPKQTLRPFHRISAKQNFSRKREPFLTEKRRIRRRRSNPYRDSFQLQIFLLFSPPLYVVLASRTATVLSTVYSIFGFSEVVK